MIGNFAPALMFTLKEEGGYSNDAHDPGGPTYKGITLVEFREYFGIPKATAADLRMMTRAMWEDIYVHKYWNGVRADELPGGVDCSVFDMGVNAGPSQSIKLLQRAVGTHEDGILGPITLKAVWLVEATTLIRRLYTEQAKFYRSLSGFKHFGKGWLNRASARMNAALSLLPSAGAVKA